MPLREDLLEPIAGDNPSGTSLRYAPVYDQIKEARRQEDELTQGIWEREVKRANYAQVAKLASEALAKKSKDLQLAAWLTEALIYEEGILGLRNGLDLIRNLLGTFWDTLYPELEDGDPFMRTGLLDWIGSHLDDAVKSVPLTRSGHDWLRYKDSRAVGYEEDCGGDSDRLEARSAAIAEGKLPAEEFDSAVNATPKAFYVELNDDIDAALASIRSLEEFTDEKFTEEPPSFSGLRASLEEFQQTVRVLLAKKREQEPEPEAVPEPGPQPEDNEFATAEPEPVAAVEAAPAPARKPPARGISIEPVDREDAINRIVAAARFLRRENAYSPVPYLMLRGLRWGELRAGGESVDQTLLEAPPSEIRQQLKRLSLQGQWEELLEAAETAMSMPCGRGWLDLQRQAVRACSELGGWYDPVANSIRSELRALLADYPALPEMTMMDDTATANSETQAWLREIGAPPEVKDAGAYFPAEDDGEDRQLAEESSTADAYDLAMEAMRSGRPEDAMSILAAEIAQVRSGRERFRRRMQLSQICLACDKELIALPILQDLAAEIEKRRLEEWEAPDLVAHPLVLLYRCMTKLGRAAEEMQAVYDRICRLDPVQAMSCVQ